MWRISTTKTPRSGKDTSDLASCSHDLTVIPLDSIRSLPNLARSHESWSDLTRSHQIWRDFADFCLHPIVAWTAQHNNLTGQTQFWKLPAQSDRVSCRLCTNPSWIKPWTAQTANCLLIWACLAIYTGPMLVYASRTFYSQSPWDEMRQRRFGSHNSFKVTTKKL